MTDTTPEPIESIDALIERLEALHRDLNPALLTTRQYEHIGWARRSVQTLLEQCREEAAAIRWARDHRVSFARVLPKGGAGGKGVLP